MCAMQINAQGSGFKRRLGDDKNNDRKLVIHRGGNWVLTICHH